MVDVDGYGSFTTGAVANFAVKAAEDNKAGARGRDESGEGGGSTNDVGRSGPPPPGFGAGG
jgi:hypothetical protein